jgi:choline dehydrogenase-like flavoprotein
MLVDQSMCNSGYSYQAKWTARNYVEDAVRNGATLLNGATALRVLTDQGRAIGVEYALKKSKRQSETRRAFGAKVVVAAGCAPTPILLRKSGIKNVADRGFAIHPGFAVYGTISGLKGTEGFGASWGLVLDDEIHIGDANFDRTGHRLLMLGERKWLRVFRYASTIAMGVIVLDSLGGELREDGQYHKELTPEDKAKLAKGEAVARKLLEHAGGRNLYTTSVNASCIAGTLRIGEHVDTKLETEIRDLYVCDGSLMPREGMTPALTLICLGKYLAKHLSRAH